MLLIILFLGQIVFLRLEGIKLIKDSIEDNK